MQYDLSQEYQCLAFRAKVESLAGKGAVVELSEKTFRTKSQNAYLHLLIGVVAMETGNTLQDAKEWYFKRTVNPDLFCVRHKDRFGNCIEGLRSTAEVSKEDMATAIDRFKRWGAENGIYMPSPGDESLLREIAMEMGRQKAYLGG